VQNYKKYRVFGSILAVVGAGCALFGIFSGHFILIPPSALNIFVGVKYLLLKPAAGVLHFAKKPVITFFSSSSKDNTSPAPYTAGKGETLWTVPEPDKKGSSIQ